MVPIIARAVSCSVVVFGLGVLVLTGNQSAFAQCPPTAISVWSLGESAPGTYFDNQGTANGACAVNCPVPVPGQIGGAQSFTGDAGIAVPPNEAYDFGPNSNFSIEAWFRTEAQREVATIVSRVDSTSSLGIFVGLIPGGRIGFSLVSTGGEGVEDFVSTPGSVADGEWHHVVAVRDNTEGQNRLYIDGVMVDTEGANYTTGFGSATAGIGIGLSLGSDPDSFFNGDLDEVAIYDVALSPEEVAEHFNLGGAGLGVCDTFAPVITSAPPLTAAATDLYTYGAIASANPAATFSLGNAPAGMSIEPTTGVLTWTPTLVDIGTHAVTVEATNSVGTGTQTYDVVVEVDVADCPTGIAVRQPLDETQGGFFRDRVGTVDMSCVGDCPQPIIGVVGGAQSFAGAGLGLVGAPDPTLDFGGEQGFALECWFRMTAGATEIFVGRIDLDNGLEVWLGQFEGKIAFLVKDTSGAPGVFAVTPETFTDGEWHHAVGVRDADLGVARVYVDGLQRVELAEDFVADFASDEASLTVGWLASGGGFPFSGDLDEVAVYGHALSARQVSDHYVRGLDGLPVCDPACPQLVSITPTLDLCSGEPTELVAEVFGSTPLTFEWSRDGQPVTGGDSPVLSLGEDAVSGLYSLTATNECGAVMGEVSVTITQSAVIVTSPQSAEVCEGDTVTLTVEASGDDLTYQWLRDGNEIRGATSVSLTLDSIDRDHLGSYRVTVTNGCGSTTSSDAVVSLASGCSPAFRRGDVNGDGRQDVADVVATLGIAATGIGVLGCEDAADFDDDGDVDDVDALGFALFYFLGGPPPPPPYDACGDDPTPDDLACRSSPCP